MVYVAQISLSLDVVNIAFIHLFDLVGFRPVPFPLVQFYTLNAQDGPDEHHGFPDKGVTPV